MGHWPYPQISSWLIAVHAEGFISLSSHKKFPCAVVSKASETNTKTHIKAAQYQETQLCILDESRKPSNQEKQKGSSK